jgi:hypothetical protein
MMPYCYDLCINTHQSMYIEPKKEYFSVFGIGTKNALFTLYLKKGVLDGCR